MCLGQVAAVVWQEGMSLRSPAAGRRQVLLDAHHTFTTRSLRSLAPIYQHCQHEGCAAESKASRGSVDSVSNREGIFVARLFCGAQACSVVSARGDIPSNMSCWFGVNQWRLAMLPGLG